MNERSIFLDALEEEDPARRSAFLDRACAGDAALRQRVEALLICHGETGGFLDKLAPERVAGDLVARPGGNDTGTAPGAGADIGFDFLDPSDKPGSIGRLGHYKLLEQIGEGGFGVVFLAEQQHPVRRRVALKVLKPGMDTRQVVARFEAERQALAIMDHPNIAKVFDGGATPSGRPYFVMELVRGVPITYFCDEHRQTPRQRLELFVPVCQAVQHAHQKGIIHRDLKPSNVLVSRHDTTPVVKVIDFGVAKALGQELTDKTLFTGFAQMVGTPMYMSPEQAGMSDLDIDTRSDVYSLGVLLYELLTGTTPFDRERFKGAGYDEIRRIIREEEPARPSTRVSTLGRDVGAVSANRECDPRALSRLLRGELDWVVMKALEKDRNRRYETASAFAADVERYLRDEPVQACPPSAGYRLRKFARRNKGPVLAGLAALLGVIAIGVVLAVSNVLISRALERERQYGHELATAFEREQQTSYLQRIASAARELAAGNLGQAEQLLDECPPERRGWEWRYLKRRRYERPRDLPPPGVVICVAYSPDGRHLAGGCLDGAVLVWDARARRAVHTWKRHGAQVQGVAFSPDGRYLASAGHDAKVLLWDLRAGRLLHALEGHTRAVTQLAFSPDGRRLASASQDRTVRLWDVATGGPALTFREHNDAVRGVAFSPEGQVISAGADGDVKVWSAATGAVAAAPRARVRWVSTMAFHPGSGRLALASSDGTVELWGDLSGQGARTLQGHTALVTGLAFSPDGRRLASTSDEKVLKVWDAATGEEAISLPIEPSTPVGVAFSPDGHQLAVGRPGKGVLVYNGAPLSGGERGEHSQALAGHLAPVVQVAFSPKTGRLVASASRDGTVKVWDEATGQELHTFQGHTAHVCGVAFSPDEQLVASGGWDETVKVWWAATGKVRHNLPSQAGVVHDVAYSPDGHRIASAHADGTVALWCAAAGRAVHRIPAHREEVEGVAFSPDSKWLATTSGRDHTTKVWEVATGNYVRTIPADTRVWSVAFRPDGGLVTATGDGDLVTWDVKTGKQRLRLRATSATRVYRVAVSPNGRWLASAGWDQTLRVLDAATGREVEKFGDHAGPVRGVAFSPDSKRLASCGGYKGMGEVIVRGAALWESARPAGKEQR